MKELKEKDILRFLDGNMSPDEKDAVLAWADSSPANQAELSLYKRINEESYKLESFQLVDVDSEWDKFVQQRSAEEPSELEILNRLDGIITTSQNDKIDRWSNHSLDNQRDLDIYEMVHHEARNLESAHPIDTDLEWSAFQKRISEVPVAEKKEAKMFSIGKIPVWQRYAIAAAVSLLLAVTIWFSLPKNPYAEFNSLGVAQTYHLDDGTIVELAPYSSLRYPKSMDKFDERRVYLDGEGKFSVAENKEKPFFVEIENLESEKAMGVHVLGTIFTIKDDDEYVKVVENIEGLVRVYKLTDADINADLEQGDKYGFDGSTFVDLNPEVVVEDNSKEYQILYVVDYLMQASDWKVTTKAYQEFDEEGIVKIDLEKPYEEVLEDLLERADFEYVPMDCNGCFRINKFTQKANP